MDSNNSESTELYCGGTAEDWHNAYSALVRGKSIIDPELYRNARRVEGELKNQKDAKEHWKSKCESLVACLESDYGIMASWDGLRKFWCIERIRKAVDGPSNGHLWVSETEYNGLVDMAEECQKWRDEYKKLGEQLDRLRNDGGLA